MIAPMFLDDVPLFGADGLPLLCDDGQTCCGETPITPVDCGFPILLGSVRLTILSSPLDGVEPFPGTITLPIVRCNFFDGFNTVFGIGMASRFRLQFAGGPRCNYLSVTGFCGRLSSGPNAGRPALSCFVAPLSGFGPASPFDPDCLNVDWHGKAWSRFASGPEAGGDAYWLGYGETITLQPSIHPAGQWAGATNCLGVLSQTGQSGLEVGNSAYIVSISATLLAP